MQLGETLASSVKYVGNTGCKFFAKSLVAIDGITQWKNVIYVTDVMKITHIFSDTYLSCICNTTVLKMRLTVFWYVV